jgi:hypothetical protein
MPDVVLHDTDRLLLVESVTSHGPFDAKRHEELMTLFAESRGGLVYTHLIHCNGVPIPGPYDTAETDK